MIPPNQELRLTVDGEDAGVFTVYSKYAKTHSWDEVMNQLYHALQRQGCMASTDLCIACSPGKGRPDTEN